MKFTLERSLSLFVRSQLLDKLCKGCTFLADGRLIRQVDGCPISVVLSNIFCVKMESDVVKPLKPKLKQIKNIYYNF